MTPIIHQAELKKKQLRIKLRLGKLARLEEGLVDSGAVCNVLPLSYCVRNGLVYIADGEVNQLFGFNGSKGELSGVISLLVKIGPGRDWPSLWFLLL